MKSALSIGMACICTGALSGLAQPLMDPKSGLAELVVPLDKPSSFLESARSSLEGALKDIPRQPKSSPQTAISKSGQFLLWGDLFKTGDCYALAELASQSNLEPDIYGVALAEWTEGKWKLRGLWKIPTVWRPKGWKNGDHDYLPTTPASQPFELLDLSADGVPEVILAGGVDKYFQENYLLRFSRKTHALLLIASAMAKPENAGKYVRLYFKSPRLAVFENWQFLKWKGEQLVPVASWHDEVGYGTNDPTFIEGERTDWRGKSTTTRVSYGKGMEYEGDGYDLTQNGTPSGRMRIVWKDEKVQLSSNSNEIENAWLFEKLTGLPRRLYPERENNDPSPRLEDLATVTIEGNKDAAKFFSAAPH